MITIKHLITSGNISPPRTQTLPPQELRHLVLMFCRVHLIHILWGKKQTPHSQLLITQKTPNQLLKGLQFTCFTGGVVVVKGMPISFWLILQNGWRRACSRPTLCFSPWSSSHGANPSRPLWGMLMRTLLVHQFQGTFVLYWFHLELVPWPTARQGEQINATPLKFSVTKQPHQLSHENKSRVCHLSARWLISRSRI